jgi:calcineurin-like phosphoesterase family protein
MKVGTNVFFIGDTHFGHKNIIKFCDGRDFDSVEEHDQGIIDRWNSVVRPKDIVWHLGDVAFGSKNISKIEQCNGIKKLILGNHDNYPMTEYLKYFTKIHGVIRVYEDFVLSHVPVHPSQLEYRWKINIHGHIHKPNEYQIDGNYMNVNADAINLTPIELSEIREKFDI